MLVTDLKRGANVLFHTVPNGSYLRTGEVYRVEDICKREIHFRNVVRGSGTSETKTMLQCAGVRFELA